MFEKQLGVLKSLKYETLALFCVLMVSGNIKDPTFNDLFAFISFFLTFGIYLWIGYKSKKKTGLSQSDCGMAGALAAFAASLFTWVISGIMLIILVNLGVYPDESAVLAGENFAANPSLGIFTVIATLFILVLVSLLSAIWGAVGSSIGYFIAGIGKEAREGKKNR